MKRWLENFTLYDLIGYFAVGVLAYLSIDLDWHWGCKWERLQQIWRFVGNLTIYQVILVAICAYMLGQILGSISQFLYIRLPVTKKILRLHDFPNDAWKDWEGLKKAIIINGYGKDQLSSSVENVHWLCTAVSRTNTPAIYGDAFKWLVYSGASRSLSVVVLYLFGRGLFHMEWVYSALVILVVYPAFYYTFARMLQQYHREVINSVLLVLSGRVSPLPQSSTDTSA